MAYLEIQKKDLYLCFQLDQGQEAKLLKAASCKGTWKPEDITKNRTARIVEIQKPGAWNLSFRGAKNFYDVPQVELVYVRHEITEEKMTIYQRGSGLLAETTYYFYEGLPVVSCESRVVNESADDIWINGITSFCYGNVDTYKKGLQNPADDLEIYTAHNTWSEECRWEHRSLRECGVLSYGNLSYDRFRIENHTGFSTGEYLTEGAIYNRRDQEGIFWQIESNGAWSAEIGAVIGDYHTSFLEKDYEQQIYLQLSGPQMEGSFWQKKLQPGEFFTTVPAAVSFYHGRPEEGIAALTDYRRRKKRVQELPVIFNDYMNCFMGSSTTELLRPYIKKAAEAGCEIFVVDCGWYDVGDWQYTFGTFEECPARYPGGLYEAMEEIRKHGMKAGLWLELESFGVENQKAKYLPKEWLFTCHGEPLIDSGRYHLDFRNPEVRHNASEIVKRLVKSYGLDYLKIDYNLCVCWGTDQHSDSLGDGLLSHNRAYLLWLEEEMKKYPEVTWENCGSGGLRMDYALLSRMDIQSVSDQEDYHKMAVIASNCASAVLPEQAGIWAYPRREGDYDETVMNMVSALPFRICLGGHLAELSADRFLLVKEAITCYKEIRHEIPTMYPIWPLGLHDFESGWLCFGLKGNGTSYLTVIRREDSKDTLEIPWKHTCKDVQVIYPKECDAEISYIGTEIFQVRLPRKNIGCFLRVYETAEKV